MNPITPGLLILQGNRLELLGQAVFEWIGRHPLAPLEEETFLVQSNGIAEWLKMEIAKTRGVCAATRVELPARFLWRSYRQVLGANAVPARSPMDKATLTWRLLQMLPGLLDRPEFLPLQRYLAAGDWERRLQLAQRLADLFDQYQVHRADWLAAWAAGDDRLPGSADAPPLPADQRWQPLLWRELLGAVGDEAQRASRPELHRRFVAALAGDAAPARPVARRAILFGLSTVPQQTLDALSALSTRCQVVLAIPNPCRYHWADIIDGRELSTSSRRRHAHRGGRDLSAIPLEDMHAHAHPLLAAWGRQGRDFVRQLDSHEDALSTGGVTVAQPVDLFDEDDGDTLLSQVQARIRDLLPPGEPPTGPRRRSDRSIAFHIAHTAQREVEILHDQLLALLADPPAEALAPRDIVVMMPDVETFAPAVRAVFGQYTRHDARFIPFNLADLRQRTMNPLLVALEWLLRLPHQRCGLSELQSLLEVPAVAARFGVAADDLPLLDRWMAGAGIRWGVHERQRADIGLAACGEQNTWLFGLQRMLLGYASGDDADFAGIEPYGEIGGLEAALVGSLATLVAAVMKWNELAGTLATATVWAARLAELLTTFFAPTDDAEQAAMASLVDAQRDWLEASGAADFEEAIPLSVVREAWLSAVDEPTLGQRFLSGGVTFCTLLPMRAVPFQVVCLIGMNDGDYPRQTQRSDFDLMGLPGQRRPGDRSRRDDDRYLMLEALLAARQVLYLSWTGRSVRDNSAQPPSVLVEQLRDDLSASWGREVVDSLTTEHPLQPFSRRYFEQSVEQGSPLRTSAREWREAHAADIAPGPASEPDDTVPPIRPGVTGGAASDSPALTVTRLARFLKNPVKAFFRQRLDVVFDELTDPVADEESFALDGLETWGLLDELLARATTDRAPDAALVAQTRRLLRAGRLPIGELGQRAADDLRQATQPMTRQWQSLCDLHSQPIGPQPLHRDFAGGTLDDWLDGLSRVDADGAPAIHLSLTASRLTEKSAVRAEALIDAWVRALAAAVCDRPVATIIVGRDAVVALPPLQTIEARPAWDELLQAWDTGMTAPLPVPSATAIAYLREPGSVRDTYDGGEFRRGEREEACLARSYPDVDALLADGRFAHWAPRLFDPLLRWVASAQVTEHPQQADVAAEPADV